eukprot:100543_1
MSTFGCILILSLNVIAIYSICIPNTTIANGSSSNNIYNGFPFYNRSSWNANNWRSDICPCDDLNTYTMIPFDNPNRITIHHTYDPRQSTSVMDSKWKMRWIQSLHQDANDWCDIGYHFLIDSAGNVFQGRPFWDDNTFVEPNEPETYKWPYPRLIQGSHSLNENKNNIGISVIGCYDDSLCEEADKIERFDQTYISLIQLTSFIADYYNISINNESIIRHRDIRDTNCPGSILSNMLEDIKFDVNNTLYGNGLCFDKTSELNGRCINSSECHNYTPNMADKQCIGNKYQICCLVDMDGPKRLDNVTWAIIVIVILTIVIFILSITICCAIKYLWSNSQHQQEETTATTELLSPKQY